MIHLVVIRTDLEHQGIRLMTSKSRSELEGRVVDYCNEFAEYAGVTNIDEAMDLQHDQDVEDAIAIDFYIIDPLEMKVYKPV